MKNLFLAIALLLITSFSSSAQMTLAHHFNTSSSTEIGLVNLSRSGQKIVVMTVPPVYAADTLFFYNTDFSFWKMIPCPRLIGHNGQFNFYAGLGRSIGVLYASEMLFNTDTFLEVAVFYQDSLPTSERPGPILIINENGTIVDSIKNVPAWAAQSFFVKGDNHGHFRAYVNTMTGPEVYDLPGTLPCDSCATSSPGFSGASERKSIITQPVPNPSKDDLKITFSLPDGVNFAELQIFDNSGKRIRTYKVDNKFGFIMLDNAQLSPGLYYYNIVADGNVSSTQKFVVMR